MKSTRKTFGRKQLRKIVALQRRLQAAILRTLFPNRKWSLERLSFRKLCSWWQLNAGRLIPSWQVTPRRPLIQRRRLTLHDLQPRRVRQVPTLEALEARVLLAAAFTQTGSTLNVNLQDSQLVTVDAGASGYTFTLSNSNTSNSWSGTTTSWVSTNGATLTVNPQGYAGLTTISIADTTSASGAAVTFGNSGSNVFQAGISVALSSNPGSVNFTGTTSFTGNNSLSVTTARDLTVNTGAVVQTADGNLSLLANTQATPTAGSFTGITVGGAVKSSGAGSVILTGVGGTTSTTYTFGVNIGNGAVVQGGTSKPLEITGTGGAGSYVDNYGIQIGLADATSVTGATITSQGSDVIVTGTGGGSGASTYNVGISMSFGQLTAGGAGNVTLNGIGGNLTGTGNENYGVWLYGNSTQKINVEAPLGNVTISGREGGGATSLGIILEYVLGSGSITISTPASQGILTLTANSMYLVSGSLQANSTNGTVLLEPLTSGVGLNVGSTSDPIGGPLSLSSTELGKISASSVLLGSAAAGTVTLSSEITRTSGISNLIFTSGPSAGVQPSASGTDLNLGSNTASLGSGTPLLINIGGNTLDSGYNQWHVFGHVKLASSPLKLAGSFTTSLNDLLTIVTASAGVTGTFGSLPNNSYVTHKGRSLQVVYNSTTVTLTDVGAATSTTLASSAPSVASQSQVTLTATVTAGATGNVAFYDGDTLLGTATLSQATINTAQFSTTALASGQHQIIAVYSGDAAHGGSNSAAFTQNVGSATTTTLVTSAASVAALSQVTFTATVTAGATGTVNFYDGSTLLGTSTLSASSPNTAQFSTSTLAKGSHQIVAAYQGMPITLPARALLSPKQSHPFPQPRCSRPRPPR